MKYLKTFENYNNSYQKLKNIDNNKSKLKKEYDNEMIRINNDYYVKDSKLDDEKEELKLKIEEEIIQEMESMELKELDLIYDKDKNKNYYQNVDLSKFNFYPFYYDDDGKRRFYIPDF